MVVRREIRRRREAGVEPASETLAVTIGALCSLVSLGCLACINGHLHVPAIAASAAIALGMLANPSARSRERGNVLAIAVPRIAAIAAGVLLLVFGQKYVRSDLREIDSDRLAASGQVQEALQAVQAARQLDPVDPFLAAKEADRILAVYEGSLTAAAMAYFESYRYYSQNPRVLLRMGGILEELGRPEEATRYFEEALFWAPSYGITRYAYAMHLLQLGRDEEANAALRWASEATAFRWTSDPLAGPGGVESGGADAD